MKKGRQKPVADDIGIWGEKQAEKYLKKVPRHKVLGRRVRVGDRDEIDLLTRDGKVLVFVEVKTRRSEDFGRPASAVDSNKRSTLSRAAVHYMKEKGFPPEYFRFDVVEVVGEIGDKKPEIRHIENAFRLDSRYKLPF